MRRVQTMAWIRRAGDIVAIAVIAGGAAYGLGLLSPGAGAGHAAAAPPERMSEATAVPSGTWVGLEPPSIGKTAFKSSKAAFVRATHVAPASTPAAPSGVTGALATPNRASIAIVIDDVGYSPAETKELDQLPSQVSFAFLPGGNDVPEQVRRARAFGHEVLLHMPMQPMNGTPVGRFGLTVGESEAQMAQRLTAALKEVPGAVGINNHMGSRFTADPDAMVRLVDVLKGRHLIFLDSRTTPRTVAAETAARAGLPTAQRSVFLDANDGGKRAVLASLARAVTLAHAEGSVLVIGHPHPATIAALKTWLQDDDAGGLQLVSLSEHVRRLGEARLYAAANVEQPTGY